MFTKTSLKALEKRGTAILAHLEEAATLARYIQLGRCNALDGSSLCQALKDAEKAASEAYHIIVKAEFK